MSPSRAPGISATAQIFSTASAGEPMPMSMILMAITQAMKIRTMSMARLTPIATNAVPMPSL
jgi:hypothetical protein